MTYVRVSKFVYIVALNERLFENPSARRLLVAVVSLFSTLAQISDKTRKTYTNPNSQFHLVESPLLDIKPLSLFIPLLRKRLNLGRLLPSRRRRTRLGSDRSGNLCRLGCFDSGFKEGRAEAEGAVGCEDAANEARMSKG